VHILSALLLNDVPFFVDWKLNIVLGDPSLEKGLKVNLFKRKEDIPMKVERGDIIVLRGGQVELFILPLSI
jgi:hypothetical protein